MTNIETVISPEMGGCGSGVRVVVQKVIGLILVFPSPHVQVSLEKVLNPKLPL